MPRTSRLPLGVGLGGVSALAAALGAAACGRREDAPPTPAPTPAPADAAAARPAVPDQISGTLTIAGKPVPITACRPGREASIYVDLVTARGALRFLAYEDRTMFWSARPEANERGAALACTDLRRSWGGATRDDGTTYFRGQIIFSCRGAIGPRGAEVAVAGDVTVDCGNISPLERKLLDDNRRRKLEEQEQARKAPAAPPAPAAPAPAPR